MMSLYAVFWDEDTFPDDLEVTEEEAEAICMAKSGEKVRIGDLEFDRDDIKKIC